MGRKKRQPENSTAPESSAQLDSYTKSRRREIHITVCSRAGERIIIEQRENEEIENTEEGEEGGRGPDDAEEAYEGDEGGGETGESASEEDVYLNNSDDKIPIATVLFPGGPEDACVLRNYETHVAFKIWNNEEREPLRCIQHVVKLDVWNFSKEPHSFQSKVMASGLVLLITVGYKCANRILISTLVERWYPETNSFHMPFGELTITLDDVQQLLQIPIVGKSLTCPNKSYGQIRDMLIDGLGLDKAIVEEEMKETRGHSIRLEWLRTNLSLVKESSNEKKIKCAVRGYLLYLLGCTLFSDKTGTKVPAIYLSCLMDIDKIKDFSWGAAGLVYLYRQLGLASRFGVKQISGFLTLLEAWSYEHFPIGRPNLNLEYGSLKPRAGRWKTRPLSGNPTNNLRLFREAFDRLRAEEVAWDPYHEIRGTNPVSEITFFTGCLKFFSIIEPYNPERVLRQFGHVQGIPPDPIHPRRAKRGPTSKNYKVDFEFLDQYWHRWHNHVLVQSDRGSRVQNPWDCADGYLEWFKKISHPLVQNPSTLSQFYLQPQQSIAANWVHHRNKAIQLLEQSIALGVDQQMEDVLQRMREVVNILNFDEVGDQPSEQLEMEQPERRRGRGHRRGRGGGRGRRQASQGASRESK